MTLAIWSKAYWVALSLPGFAVTGALPARAQTADEVTVVGTLTDEGVECPALRGDDGALYTLTPREGAEAFGAGDRVEVEGRVAQMSFCQQGMTLDVTRIGPAD